jgi:hypothetical protein
MEHPLIGDLTKLTESELTDKIADLNKKLSIAARNGNGHLCDQLRMAIESYRTRYNALLEEARNNNTNNFNDKINIS